MHLVVVLSLMSAVSSGVKGLKSRSFRSYIVNLKRGWQVEFVLCMVSITSMSRTALNLSSDTQETLRGYDPGGKKLSSLEHAAAGSFSGAVTRFLCQPLDVLKIRFQLQVEPVSPKADSKYRGLIQALSVITTEEGVSALWKGHVPAQLLSVIYGSVQFLSFEVLTKQLWYLYPSKSESHRASAHFLCGSLAGVLATLASFPADTVRTRLVAQGQKKVYHGILDAFSSIYRTEGTKAFFKGLNPTLIQIAPHAGAQFSFYTVFKGMWQTLTETESIVSKLQSHNISATGSLVCGSLAGIFAKIVVYPLDLARKRLQIQGFEEARKPFGKVFRCSGLIECLKLTLTGEKWKGLFKGLYPSLLKAAAATALHFCVYEKSCEALALLHK